MNYKSLIAKIAIILIIAMTFINSYNRSNNLVYADDATDQWLSVTTNDELAWAFKYYCKSRNLAIEGSVLDAVTSFTTFTFNNLCSEIGIDVTALQAHIKRSTDSNGGLQFLFDQTGITAYNRIFAEFLQNNNLYEGDTADEQDNTLYSGQVFTDNLGRSCLVYISNGLDLYHDTTGKTLYKGTPYIYSTSNLVSLVNSSSYSLNIVCNNINVTRNLVYQQTWWISNSQQYYNCVKDDSFDGNLDSKLIYASSHKNGSNYSNPINGNYAITYNVVDSKYYLTLYNEVIESSTYVNNRKVSNTPISLANDTVQNTTIFLTTNNNTINNNTYNDNKQTVINNEGDVYNYDYDDEEPPINPGGGDTNVNIDFPNFNFPDFPDIDFSLKGLTDKFPFCIPFDMVALLQLLNAEPQAPRIQGQIPFGSFYTWNLDLDFSRFDDFAVIMRGLEFVGFIFFLISATINIAKG